MSLMHKWKMYFFSVHLYNVFFVYLDEDFYEEDDEDDPDALKDPIYQIDLQVTSSLYLCTARSCLVPFYKMFLFPPPPGLSNWFPVSVCPAAMLQHVFWPSKWLWEEGFGVHWYLNCIMNFKNCALVYHSVVCLQTWLWCHWKAF